MNQQKMYFFHQDNATSPASFVTKKKKKCYSSNQALHLQNSSYFAPHTIMLGEKILAPEDCKRRMKHFLDEIRKKKMFHKDSIIKTPKNDGKCRIFFSINLLINTKKSERILCLLYSLME